MKPRFSNKPTNAFTLMELLVVIAVLFILLALVDFGPPPSAKKKAQRIARINNLKEIGLTDGSVQQLTTDGLRQALQQTGVATNRLPIP